MDACDVCGRTILAGESARSFVSAEGRHAVCVLCVGRAESFGWRPREEIGEGGLPARRQRRRFRLGDLFAGRREDSEEADEEPDPALPDFDPRVDRSPDPAAPGRTTGRIAIDPSPLSPFERALARYNASDAPRTVAGLARTLGAPWVSVGAAAGAAHEVRITVAWELCWYQWGVDLGDELRPVFQIDKGHEVDQLDAAARQWNARAGEGGRVALNADPVADPAGR